MSEEGDEAYVGEGKQPEGDDEGTKPGLPSSEWSVEDAREGMDHTSLNRDFRYDIGSKFHFESWRKTMGGSFEWRRRANRLRLRAGTLKPMHTIVEEGLDLGWLKADTSDKELRFLVDTQEVRQREPRLDDMIPKLYKSGTLTGKYQPDGVERTYHIAITKHEGEISSLIAALALRYELSGEVDFSHLLLKGLQILDDVEYIRNVTQTKDKEGNIVENGFIVTDLNHYNVCERPDGALFYLDPSENVREGEISTDFWTPGWEQISDLTSDTPSVVDEVYAARQVLSMTFGSYFEGVRWLCEKQLQVRGEETNTIEGVEQCIIDQKMKDERLLDEWSQQLRAGGDRELVTPPYIDQLWQDMAQRSTTLISAFTMLFGEEGMAHREYSARLVDRLSQGFGYGGKGVGSFQEARGVLYELLRTYRAQGLSPVKVPKK